jgi:hypothetical protein
MQPIVLKIVNAAGFGYFNGTPDYSLKENYGI